MLNILKSDSYIAKDNCIPIAMTSWLEYFSENSCDSKDFIAKGMNFRYAEAVYSVSYMASACTNDYSNTDCVTVIVSLLFSPEKISIDI
jgi:hypothetical protein